MTTRPKSLVFRISLIINIIVASSIIFMSFPAASAQEVCLKDLPDSAWSNGEPQNLDRQGLSTRFLLNAPGESLIRYENVPIQLVYQYLGNTCTLRSVNVTYVYNPVLQEMSIEDFIENYKNSATDLFGLEARIAALRDFQKIINGSVFSLLVNTELKGTLEWSSDVKKINDSLARILSLGFSSSNPMFNVAVRPIIELDSNCGKSENISDDKNFSKLVKREFFGPMTFNAAQESPPPIVFQLKKVSCRAKISLIFGEAPRRGEGPTPNIQTFEKPLVSVLVGEVTINSKNLTKKTTIECIKGKFIKKITALNPKCPTGYKKR